MPLKEVGIPMRVRAMIDMGYVCMPLGVDVTIDNRVFYMRILKNITITSSVALVYPRMLPIHVIPDNVGKPNEFGLLQLPQNVRASVERLQTTGVYILGKPSNAYRHMKAGINTTSSLVCLR